jgi:hypothetical protein
MKGPCFLVDLIGAHADSRPQVFEKAELFVRKPRLLAQERQVFRGLGETADSLRHPGDRAERGDGRDAERLDRGGKKFSGGLRCFRDLLIEVAVGLPVPVSVGLAATVGILLQA